MKGESLLKYITAVLFLIFGCIACSYQTEILNKQEEELTDQKESDSVTVKAGNIEYELHNTSITSKDQIKKLEKEIIEMTELIQNTVQTNYNPSKKIHISLHNGPGVSTGFRSNIKLYFIIEEKYPLVHELSHTLLGYGENFSAESGYFTQEGFAVYMQTKYGKPSFPNYGISEHNIMRYLIKSHRNIPLYKLIEDKSDDELFRPLGTTPQDYALVWLSYLHAGSFVKYVFETYGNENFEKIYNKTNLANVIEENYGKSIETLEKEWINYILENETDLTTEDKMKIDDFYSIISSIKSIDDQVFKR